jgi:hypothetical protein
MSAIVLNFVKLFIILFQIATARLAFTARQKMGEFLKAGPENLIQIARAYFQYIRDVLKQLSEVHLS